MTNQPPEPSPGPDAPPLRSKFQELLDSGALERVQPSSPEESTYKLHVDAILRLRPGDTNAPAEPAPDNPDEAPG